MKPTRAKRVWVFPVIVVLFSGLLILVMSKANVFSKVHAPVDLDLSAAPTPYPLPTQVYGPSPVLQTIFSRLFGKRDQSLDPTLVTEGRKLADEGPYMDLYVKDDFLPVEIAWWQKESKTVYGYVGGRLDATLGDKVTVTFMPPKTGNCAPRGTTWHEEPPIVVIFADKDTVREQILATLAHELAHVFIHKKYGNLSDLALTEGLATWAAGDYWRAWKGYDFDSGVKTFVSGGTYLPLYSNYDMKLAYYDDSSDCIAHRDILLTEMASFIDHLYRSYGAEKVSALFDMKQPEVVNGRRIVYPPDYKGTFGLELNQLEYIWLKTLVKSN